MEAQEHLIKVERTARYLSIGIPGPHIKHLWYVLHGYGQLASFFIKHFHSVAEHDTLIVAPEGLSLFYVPPGWTRVGATWMTREKRSSEIEDYLRYLAQVHDAVKKQVPDDCTITILGFSQGATTAWRWVESGTIAPDNFINWAGAVPEEYRQEHHEWEKEVAMFYVRASDDEYIAPIDAQKTTDLLRIKNPNLSVHPFEGNHRMDDKTLKAIHSKISS